MPGLHAMIWKITNNIEGNHQQENVSLTKNLINMVNTILVQRMARENREWMRALTNRTMVSQKTKQM